MNSISLLSATVSRVEIFAERTEMSLGFASGFICRYKGYFFFITNWHVVTGKNFLTNESLHSSGATPGSINIKFVLLGEENDSQIMIHPNELRIDLYKDEAEEFISHPVYGSKVDVVAIPLELTSLVGSYKICCIDIDKEIAKRKVDLYVMQSLFIIGFPLVSDLISNTFPIYKHATIASEPKFYPDLPFFFVDGKTKKGMSGSAVIHKDNLSGKPNLIGVYSGRDRIEKTEFEAELGIVWPFELCLLPTLEEYVSRAKAEPSNVIYKAYD